MSFTLLPAVDVAGGRAVRPAQGSPAPDSAGVDPIDAALRWQSDGAEWIHLVDLDAAFGTGSNADLLTSVILQLDVRTELSGGIADAASLQGALASGCDRIILATHAVDDMQWCSAAIDTHRERIAIALDLGIEHAAGGRVRHRLTARGRHTDHGDLWATLHLLDRVGCERYIVTDVTRDGMLSGPDVDLYRAVTEATPAQVIASGGISSIADLTALAELAETAPNLEGAIVGAALYADRFTLADAFAAVEVGKTR